MKTKNRKQKRLEVETLLTDPEWKSKSDRAITSHCGVSAPFVGKIRTKLGIEVGTRSDLKGRIIDVANIGKKCKPKTLEDLPLVRVLIDAWEKASSKTIETNQVLDLEAVLNQLNSFELTDLIRLQLELPSWLMKPALSTIKFKHFVYLTRQIQKDLITRKQRRSLFSSLLVSSPVIDAASS